VSRTLDQFKARFGASGDIRLSRAPGRVNLIGEHTDYNGGFVLPLAIDRSVDIIFRPRGDGKVRLWSVLYEREETFELGRIEKSDDQPWTNYVKGVAVALREEGVRPGGMDALISGAVPLGAGLSSSAAFEVAAAQAFIQCAGVEIEPERLARLCQRAENEFVGVKCGIMDQFVSIFGRRGAAVLIDCMDLSHELVPLDDRAVSILICNTMVRHELGSSQYNIRRRQCETAAREMARHKPGAKLLRDFTWDEFEQWGGELSTTLRMRARHVIGENRRVGQAVQSLRRGDYEAVGARMNESHASLQSDYEVSCIELDVMSAEARKLPGVYGARMTGGGFGGCAVALARAGTEADVASALSQRYEEATGIKPEIYACRPAEGARVEPAT